MILPLLLMFFTASSAEAAGPPDLSRTLVLGMVKRFRQAHDTWTKEIAKTSPLTTCYYNELYSRSRNAGKGNPTTATPATMDSSSLGGNADLLNAGVGQAASQSAPLKSITAFGLEYRKKFDEISDSGLVPELGKGFKLVSAKKGYNCKVETEAAIVGIDGPLGRFKLLQSRYQAILHTDIEMRNERDFLKEYGNVNSGRFLTGHVIRKIKDPGEKRGNTILYWQGRCQVLHPTVEKIKKSYEEQKAALKDLVAYLESQQNELIKLREVYNTRLASGECKTAEDQVANLPEK